VENLYANGSKVFQKTKEVDRRRYKDVGGGWPIGMPVSKHQGGGLHEVRTKLSDSRISRVIFYIDKKGRLVLLHGLIKKTLKLPHQDLELARKNRSNHERGLK